MIEKLYTIPFPIRCKALNKQKKKTKKIHYYYNNTNAERFNG